MSLSNQYYEHGEIMGVREKLSTMQLLSMISYYLWYIKVKWKDKSFWNWGDNYIWLLSLLW